MEATRTHMLYPRQSQGSSQGGGSNSLSGIISTLVPTFIIAAIAFTCFLFVRTRYSRVYRPRNDERLLDKEGQTQTQAEGGGSSGFFGLMRNYRGLPDSYVLRHNSLDGYLWLRYFKMLILISFVGCCITWPVLFPVNATGGGGQQQLDILSMSNIVNPNRYYAQALIGCIFLGFVVALIARERINLIGLRRAYFLSATHAQRLSSRTLMILGLPHEYQDEKALRQMFGSSVRKVWLPTDCDKLADAVKTRRKTALKLENAEIKVIMEANKRRLKSEKEKNTSPAAPAGEQAPAPGQAAEQQATDANRWIDAKKRPTHRLMPQIWKKVDTLNWCRGTLTELDRFVPEQQSEHLDLKHPRDPAAFIEFTTQSAAQHAFQCVGTGSKTQFRPRYIGIAPSEVVWKNLSISNTSRKIKLLGATAVIWVMVLFWTIPVAFVGSLSNINYLTNKVHFLSFINDIPQVVLGVVTGLLPVVLLAVLMALVPIFCGLLAKLAGEPTLPAIELRIQSWYFIFQVIQVFLITTFTSGAAAVASQIVADPASAPTLLAINLPKASNFYISYFILFGLMQAAMQLLNVVPLLMYTVVGKLLDKSPRKQYNRFISMAGMGWGSTYPKFTNLGVIAISYSCISPLLLGFSTIGFALLYLMFRYNWLFVFGNQTDMKGQSYDKGLRHLLVGVYLSAFCLIGMFAIGCSNSPSSAGPLAIMVVFLVVAVVFQVLFDRALAPIEHALPLELLSENKYSTVLLDQTLDETEMKRDQMEAGASSRGDSLPDEAKAEGDGAAAAAAKPAKQPFAMLTRRIEPFVQKYYEANQRMIPQSEDDAHWMPAYTSEEYEHAYLNPAITDPAPIVWLPKDKAGVSKVMVADNREANIQSTDEHAELNEKNKVVWEADGVREAPLWERPVRY